MSEFVRKMTRKTKASSKQDPSVPDHSNDIVVNDEKENTGTEQSKTEPSNQDILDKLSSLDRIENKIDNLNCRVVDLETRVSTIEDNSTSQAHEISEVNKNIQGLKNDSTDLQKRVETLENRDRQHNIKILNLPANPWETKEQLLSKIKDILKHVNPEIPDDIIMEARRLAGPRATKVGQPSTSSRTPGPPPVLVRLDGAATTVQDILKTANKKLRTYKNNSIRMVDDVSQITQVKRASLIPRMKELRAANLFAYIPFGPNAKIVYRENNE